LVSIWRQTKLVHVKKIGTKLNKNNEYRDKIEYKILTLTRIMLLGWHVDI